jgi:hypothetical protein
MSDGYAFEVWLNGKCVGYVFALNHCEAKQKAIMKYGKRVEVEWYVG